MNCLYLSLSSSSSFFILSSYLVLKVMVGSTCMKFELAVKVLWLGSRSSTERYLRYSSFLLLLRTVRYLRLLFLL